MSARVTESVSDVLLASYDAVPYGGGAIAGTRPDYIAAVARLRGLRSPDVKRCRVLDIGCATGGNLLAMAVTAPESTFVGIDLSPMQIETARRAALALGIDNVRFHATSIAAVDESFGNFDYILCHGVYSWVPAHVQQAILRVCARSLAPEGIAYVSYNTYPGWHARGLVRDMMLFHDRPEMPPSDRVRRARGLLAAVASNVPQSDTVYAAVLREEMAALSDATESYFVHEELESENHPVYFIEFARRAASVGLQYIAESSASLTDAQITAELRSTLRSWSAERVQYEQYLDYVRNRTFRRTLLCHAGRVVSEEPDAEAVRDMWIRGRCFVDSEAPDARQPDVEVFRTNEGVSATLAHPVVRAALHALIDARPGSLSFAELAEQTRSRMAPGRELSTALLADAMLNCAMIRLADLTMAPMPCTARLNVRPVASSLARLEARNDVLITTLVHTAARLSPFDRFVLRQLDGTRDAPALADEVAAAASRGELELALADSVKVRDAVGHALEQFRLSGLLVS